MYMNRNTKGIYKIDFMIQFYKALSVSLYKLINLLSKNIIGNSKFTFKIYFAVIVY